MLEHAMLEHAGREAQQIKTADRVWGAGRS